MGRRLVNGAEGVGLIVHHFHVPKSSRDWRLGWFSVNYYFSTYRYTFMV